MQNGSCFRWEVLRCGLLLWETVGQYAVAVGGEAVSGAKRWRRLCEESSARYVWESRRAYREG